MGFPTGGSTTVCRIDYNSLVNILKYNPCINLLANGSFEITRPGSPVQCAYWFGSWFEKVRQLAFQPVYGNMIALYEPDPSQYMFQEIANYDDFKGRVVSFGTWLNSTTPVMKLRLDDGIRSTTSVELGTSNQWIWMEITHTVDLNATKVSCEIIRTSGSGNAVWVDGAVLCLGTGIPRSGFIPIDFGVLARRQGKYSAAPSWTAEKGDQYFNTTTSKSYIYDGTTWNALW